MLLYKFKTQGPENGNAVIRLIKESISLVKFDRITATFAYATEAGVKLLVATLKQHSKNWNRVEKRWILSIDYGITEPEALEQLSLLNRSEVRISNANVLLKRRLMPVISFHPKTIILESIKNSKKSQIGLIVGSANLTISGLCFNYEHITSTILKGKLNKLEKNQLNLLRHEIEDAPKIVGIKGEAKPLNYN